MEKGWVALRQPIRLRLSFAGSEDVKPNGNLQSGEALVANDDSNLQPARAQLTEPPYADPHVRWCGRGEWATTPPMRFLYLVIPSY